MKKSNDTTTRQQAQDLILLAHKMLNNSSPVNGLYSIQELLLILSESNLTLVSVDPENTLAEFAIQLMDNPELEVYNSSIEVLV